MSQSEGSSRREAAWPSGLERILEVAEEMWSREELLKLLVLLEYLSYKGRGSGGGDRSRVEPWVSGGRMTGRAKEMAQP